MNLRPTLLFVTTALIAACATTPDKSPDPTSGTEAAAAQSALPASDESTVVDPAYLFQLRRPSPEWMLQDKDQIARIAPAARAGALNLKGFFGAIVVENVGGMELPAYADLLMENMPVAEKQIVSKEQVRFLDRDAIRFVMRGRVEDMNIHYEDTVFLHQGFGYQLLGWTDVNRANANKAWFAPFRDAFSLLPGQVKGEGDEAPAQVADQVGPGWRIKDGTFESAALGFRVKPPGRWKLSIGQELAKMNSQAEIGFEQTSPDLYGVVLGERTPKAKRDEHLAQMERESVSGMQVTRAAGDVHVRIAGKDVTLHRYRGPSQRPVDMLYGLHCEGELCFQLITWRLGALGELDLESMKQLLGSIDFMDAAEKRKLTAELEKEPDPQTAVGTSWAYRNGRYTDFANGLTWKRPAGMWRVFTGDAAKELGETIDVYLTEPVKGLYGLVMRDSPQAEGAAAHHEAVANLVLGEAERRPAKKVGDLFVSEGTSQSDIGYLRYRVATRVAGESAWRLVFWGRPLDVVDGAKALDAVFAGFSFEAPQQAETVGERRIDRRMGFAYAPPDTGWKLEDITPPEMKPRGTVVTYRKGPDGVIVMAVHAQGVSDPDWFPSFASEMFQRLLRRKSDAAPVKREATIAGRKGQHLSFREGNSNSDVFLTRDGHTFYALFVLTDSPDPKRLSQLVRGFELLGR